MWRLACLLVGCAPLAPAPASSIPAPDLASAPGLLDHLVDRFKPGLATGALIPSAGFDRAVDWKPQALRWAERSSTIIVDVDADGRLDVVYTAGDQRAYVPQIALDAFGFPIAIDSGDCLAVADLVGDEAWDLVCVLRRTPGSTAWPPPPRLHIIEGYVAANGETGVDFDRVHVISDDPMIGHIEGITVRDLDGDGLSDLAACALMWPEDVPPDRGWSWVLWQEPTGTWVQQRISRGECFAFAAYDYDRDGRLDLHMLTERGHYLPNENENAVFLQRDDRTWKRTDLGGEDDSHAYLGGEPAASPLGHSPEFMKGSPMGWAAWDLEQDGDPELWFSQGEQTSPIFRHDGSAWRSIRGEIPGIAVADPDAAWWPGDLFYWGAAAVDVDGNGLDDLIASEGPDGASRGRYGLHVLLHQVDRIAPLDGGQQVSGGFYGLSVAPIFGARPYFATGSFQAPPRVWENRMDRAGEWLVLKLLGRGGEGASVEISGCEHRWIHHPNNHANPHGGSAPWVIRGLGACDRADVTVRRGARVQTFAGLEAGTIHTIRDTP